MSKELLQFPPLENPFVLPTGKYHISGMLHEVVEFLKLDKRVLSLVKKTDSGVYAIANMNNNKCYFGSASNISIRFANHKIKLSRNKHSNTHLQRSWNRHGAISFLFLPLGRVEIENLLLVEQDILDLVGTNSQNIYNICEEAKSRLGCVETKETIKKKSLMFSGKGNPMWGKTHSDDTKELIRQKALGRKCTEETKRKMSSAHCGRTHTQKTKNIMSKKAAGQGNGFYGKKHSKKSIEKMKKSKERYNRPIIASNILTEELLFFVSIAKAAEFLGLQSSSISRVLAGKYKRSGNWIFYDKKQ